MGATASGSPLTDFFLLDCSFYGIIQTIAPSELRTFFIEGKACFLPLSSLIVGKLCECYTSIFQFLFVIIVGCCLKIVVIETNLLTCLE